MADNFPDVYRVALNYAQGGLEMTNIFNFLSIGGTAEGAGENCAEIFADTIGDQISNQVDWTTWTARELVPTGLEASGDWSGFTSGGGTNTSPPEAPGVAFVITWVTGVGGRANRGRSYIGGCGSDLTSDPTASWNATAVTNMTADANTFVANMFSVGYTLCVVSRVGTPHTTTVLNGVAKAQFGSQRRRNYN